MKQQIYKLSFSLIFSILFFSTNAQNDLRSHIPSEVQMVLMTDYQQIDKKVGMDKIQKLDFIKSIKKEILKDNDSEPFGFLVDPKSAGVSIQDKNYSFYVARDSLLYFAHIFKIENQKLFEGKLLDTALNIQNNTDYRVSFKMISNRDYKLCWTNDWGLVLFGSYLNYDYGMDYSDRKAKENAIFEDLGAKIINLDVSESILNNRNFKARSKEKYDMAFWINSMENYWQNALPMAALGRIYGETSEYQTFINKVTQLYEDNYTFLKLSFENGEIRITGENQVNDELLELNKKLVNTKAKLEFLKYLDSENVLAYYYASLNVKELFSGTHDIMYPLVRSFPNYGEMVCDIWDLVDLALDEDRLYKLFTGDMLFALTDIREFETQYVTYKYDEDFNREKVVETKKEQLPEFLVMLSTEDEESINKIFNIIEKAQPGSEKFMHNMGSYYKLDLQGEVDFNLYLVVYDGIIFFTNNDNLIQNHLFSNNFSPSVDLSASFKNNYMYSYWNIEKTIEKMPEDAKREMKREFKSENVLEDFPLETLKMNASRKTKGNIFPSEINFKTNNSKNALKSILNFVNELYLQNQDQI